jgi:hypothetical protein
MLAEYFTPIHLSQEYTSHQIGSTIQQYDQEFPELVSGKVALITVVKNKEDYSQVRESLYCLTAQVGFTDKLIDLGDIISGNTPAETNAALEYVCQTLRKEGLSTIVLGNDINQGEAIYKSMEGHQNHLETTLISSHLPLLEYELLNRICTLEPSYLGQLNVLGFQAHYVPPKALDMLENLNFGHLRLGQLRNKLEDAELYLRDTDLVLFDINALKYTEAPAQKNINPNGLNGDEACQIARYTGMGNSNIGLGIFGYINEKDDTNLTAALISQMIWYYIDGIVSRVNDTPQLHTEFVKYRCDFSLDDAPLLFLKSKRTSRWWMTVEHPGYPENESMNLTIPCSYDDYIEAANGERPARYYQALKRV